MGFGARWWVGKSGGLLSWPNGTDYHQRRTALGVLALDRAFRKENVVKGSAGFSFTGALAQKASAWVGILAVWKPRSS